MAWFCLGRFGRFARFCCFALARLSADRPGRMAGPPPLPQIDTSPNKIPCPLLLLRQLQDRRRPTRTRDASAHSRRTRARPRPVLVAPTSRPAPPGNSAVPRRWRPRKPRPIRSGRPCPTYRTPSSSCRARAASARAPWRVRWRGR